MKTITFPPYEVHTRPAKISKLPFRL